MRLLVTGLILVGILLATVSSGAEAAKEIVFWDTVWGLPDRYPKAVEEVVAEFNRQHPDIRVKYESIPWAGYYERFLTAVLGGVGPDISSGASFQPLQFAEMGEIFPLNALYDEWRRTGALKDFYPGSYSVFLYKGEYTAVPWNIDPRVLVYRTDLFKEAGLTAPRTWEELRQAAIKLNRPPTYGIVFPGGNEHITQHIYLSFMIQNGGSIVDKQGRLVFNSKENVEALRFMTDLALKDKATPPGIAAYGGDQVSMILATGRAAMAYGSMQVIRYARAHNPDLAKKLAVAPVLTGPAGIRRTAGYFNGLMVYKRSKNVDAALTFLKWYLRPENLSRVLRAADPLPATVSVARDPFYQEDPLLATIVNEVLPYIGSFNWPAEQGFPQLAIIDGEKMLAVPVSEVLTGQRSSEAAVASAAERMQRLFK